MSQELQELQKELWKTYQVVKSINSIAETRALDEEEKDKLQFLIKQIRSIQAEIKEEKDKAENSEISD